MKAKSPLDGKWYYFVDKCLPFGAAISCSIFQAFSDALAFIVWFKTKLHNINYLDDFFFVALLKAVCDHQINQFIEICHDINFPVSMEKTFWGSKLIVFLGLLIDTNRQIIGIPVEKVTRAVNLVQKMPRAKKRKVTVHDLQSLAGFLNFLCKAIVPGRVFTRRMYSIAPSNLKKHHHVKLTHEVILDLEMWLSFLNDSSAYSRPFADFDISLEAEELDWYTDASTTLGCGGYFKTHWFIAEWEWKKGQPVPSINYLELFALTVSVINWAHLVRNKRVVLHCDNQSVVSMVNNTTSSCPNCMVLLRIITLISLKYNVKLTCRHVSGVLNIFADLLSRLKYKEFRALARKTGKKFNAKSTEMPEAIWPISSIWV